MDADKDKNVSCFTLDGIVAEMVIEVEDNQRTGYDDYKDLPVSSSKNGSLIDEDVDSENKTNNAEVATMEILKKEEGKKITVDIPKTSNDIKDDKKKNNSIQNAKKDRKRKFDLNLNHDVENGKASDLPRYPGRKRQANKRYISDDMVTSVSDKSESFQSKETLKGEKKRKIDSESKDVKGEKVVLPKKSDQNGKEESGLNELENSSTKEESGLNVLENSSTKEESVHFMKDEFDNSIVDDYLPIVDDELETEDPKSNPKILRKLPFRKNRDAPDVPDLKPKVFWWNGVGEGLGVKLGDMPEVKKRIKGAKSIRSLYRVLFFQWPTNGQDLISQILNFNGFPFDKVSYEFTKRQSLMKIMLDVTISNICDILGVQKGSKVTMINNILTFLLKPNGKIDPAMDPCMQPVVLLERIVLDNTFFEKSPESVKSKRVAGSSKAKVPASKNKQKSFVSSSVTPVRLTRNSMSRLKTVEAPVNRKTPTKGKYVLKASSVKTKSSSSKEIVSKTSPKGKTTLATKDIKLSKGHKLKVEERAKSGDKIQKSGNENDAPNKIRKIKKLKKLKKKSKPFTKHKVLPKKKSSDNEPKNKAVDNDIGMDIDKKISVEESVARDDEPSESTFSKEKDEKESEKESNLDLKETNVSTVIVSDSSETESAEETKLAQKTSQKLPQKRKGKPLKMFPKISESIKKANFSALQRLHILLFGASDKAENLKGNILAFGGFPFLEGSDEWKQKHFLLSLLAQNNLREYLKLLCIEFSDDDQPTMINKLMRFLAVPSENAVENKSPEIEREVVSPELTNKEPAVLSKKGKVVTKKKNVKKKEGRKPNGRQRKVLMSEEEARRLEASYCREQRALARDSRSPPPITKQPAIIDPYAPSSNSMQPQVATPKPPKPPITDPQQLNALLQTVYKRRALKAAGAVISTPNKGEKIKLGDIENIKFLIVTSNFRDLEILHQLIYMVSASKSRLRKNILDFDGFGFNEDSKKYKERMDFLNNLGYAVSKRLSFLLGLCSFQTDIPQQDLNELVMYFLMSPCKSKQVVPITQMPVNPTIGLPEENHVILKPSLEMDKSSFGQTIFQTVSESTAKPKVPEISIQSSTLPSSMCQKAKKSFNSGIKLSPLKKVLLPPAVSSSMGRMLNFNTMQSIANISSSVAVLNSTHALPTYSLPKTTLHNTGTSISLLNNPGNVAVLNASKPSTVNALIKVPVVNPASKVQLMSQAPKVAVLDAATKIPMSNISHIAGQIIQSPVIFPNISGKVGLQPQQNVVPAPVLPGSKMLVRTPSGISQQEFLVQQQTPDGQQKTFKLIRLPPNHPLASAVKPPVQQTISTPQVQQPVIITGSSPGALPPGIVVMKNNSALQLPGQNVQNILQTVPLNINIPLNKPSSPVVTTSFPNTDEFVLPDQGESAVTSGNEPDVEILNPLEDNPPTDEELYSSIQEIILSSNFEDITLRNVIERVSAQFPHHDLTHRHNFMKDCVKKIIIGT